MHDDIKVLELQPTTAPVYEWIKYDADLVHSLLQYMLSVLHQLLHLSEHVVQADRASLQGVPHQDHFPGPRRASGRPEQAQSQRHRQQHDSGHLSSVSSSSSCEVAACPSVWTERRRRVWRTEGAQAHAAGSVFIWKVWGGGGVITWSESGLMAWKRFKLHFMK